MSNGQPNNGKGIAATIHSLYIAPLIVGLVVGFILLVLDNRQKPETNPLPSVDQPLERPELGLPVVSNGQPLPVNIAVLWRDYYRNSYAVLQTYGGRLIEVSGDLKKLSDVHVRGVDENYALVVKDDQPLICEFDQRHGVWFESLLSATVQGVLEEGAPGQYISSLTGQPVSGLRLAHSKIIEIRLQTVPMIIATLVMASIISLFIRWLLKRVGLLTKRSNPAPPL